MDINKTNARLIWCHAVSDQARRVAHMFILIHEDDTPSDWWLEKYYREVSNLVDFLELGRTADYPESRTAGAAVAALEAAVSTIAPKLRAAMSPVCEGLCVDELFGDYPAILLEVSNDLADVLSEDEPDFDDEGVALRALSGDRNAMAVLLGLESSDDEDPWYRPIAWLKKFTSIHPNTLNDYVQRGEVRRKPIGRSGSRFAYSVRDCYKHFEHKFSPTAPFPPQAK